MKKLGRLLRHKRITKRIIGTKDRPRLVVFRSKKHLYVQVVDDSKQSVLLGSSTLSKDFKNKKIKTNTKEGAKALGSLFAQKILTLKLDKVSLDRAGYAYHGRLKALADGMREAGIKF